MKSVDIIVSCLIFTIFFFILWKIKKNTEENFSIKLDVDYKENENAKLSYTENTFTALIVEPRKHKALEFVLQNFFENLDSQWNFVILHGIENETYVKDIINKLEKHKYRTNLINLGVKNLKYQEYNELFYTEKFYSYIHTETFLIFQTDSMILKKNKHKINDFLQYDYVGAPWIPSIYGDYGIGNGGLSLRKKSKMLKLLKYKHLALSNNYNNLIYKNEYGKYIAEDRFFNGDYTKNFIKINKPTIQNAESFSVESIYNNSPFGIHKCWYHLPKNDLIKLTSIYPEINTLIKYNN